MNAAFEGIKPGTEGLGVVRAQLGIRCWVRFLGLSPSISGVRRKPVRISVRTRRLAAPDEESRSESCFPIRDQFGSRRRYLCRRCLLGAYHAEYLHNASSTEAPLCVIRS